MDSAESKHSNRQQNATENDDVASVAGESSPRRDAVSKQGGGSGSEDSVGCGVRGNARVLNNKDDDFQKNDQDSDQDLLSDARDSELKLEVDDPLLKSIHNLKLSQDALQQEIEKFKEIGNETSSHDDDGSTKCRSEAAGPSAVDLEFHDSCSSGHSDEQNSSSSRELQIASLTEKIDILENKLYRLKSELEQRDGRILILEYDLYTKEESTSTIGEKCKELESELESLFLQKVEAEVKYLTIKKMMKSLKVASTFTEKQETMSGNKMQNPNKREVAGKYRGKVLGAEETFMIQRRLCNLHCTRSLSEVSRAKEQVRIDNKNNN